jgi:hypothetical protein
VAALDRYGYARLVGGHDEAHARAVLIAMQERLAGDPYSALGIPQTATTAEVRTAFLQLTKTYHPARFGYMSTEIQKLANEVFLLLRAAHDFLAKPGRAWGSKSDRSGSFLAVQKSDRSGVFPAVADRSDRSGVFPAVADKSDRSGVFPASEKTDRSGALPAPIAHAPARPQPGAPATGRVTTARLSAPPMAPSSDPRVTPTAGVRVLRPPAAPSRPIAGRPPSPPPGAPVRSDDRELAGALEQLQRGQWDAARATLSALAEHAPSVPRYRALLSYARGREAQLAQRLDEARVELQDALQIDPDLQLAKTALAELFTRRK